ncbi:hypothetical protein SRHO_G00295320 [Serrasalmus rhombeus]
MFMTQRNEEVNAFQCSAAKKLSSARENTGLIRGFCPQNTEADRNEAEGKLIALCAYYLQRGRRAPCRAAPSGLGAPAGLDEVTLPQHRGGLKCLRVDPCSDCGLFRKQEGSPEDLNSLTFDVARNGSSVDYLKMRSSNSWLRWLSSDWKSSLWLRSPNKTARSLLSH